MPGGEREGGSQGEKGGGKNKKWPGSRQDQKWSILYRIVVSGELGCDGVLFENLRGLAWVVVARHTDPNAKPLKEVFQRGHQRDTPKRHDL